MGRTRGEPDEIKKNTHPKNFTALFRERTDGERRATPLTGTTHGTLGAYGTLGACSRGGGACTGHAVYAIGVVCCGAGLGWTVVPLGFHGVIQRGAADLYVTEPHRRVARLVHDAACATPCLARDVARGVER